MTRLVVGFFLLGVLCSVQARKCDPNEGTEPLPCDPSVCVLPDCACETSEPDIPLADRPQVSISEVFGGQQYKIGFFNFLHYVYYYLMFCDF